MWLQRCIAIAGLMIALVLGSRPATAQGTDPAAFSVDEAGACERDKLTALPGVDRQATGQGFTFTVTLETRLTRANAARALEVSGSLPQFTRVYLWAQPTPGGRILVSTDNLSKCGWAAPDDLLLDERQIKSASAMNQTPLQRFGAGPEPVEVRDGPTVSGADKGNRLRLKVVLHNLNSSGKEIAVYSQPGGTVVKKLRFFDIYEVFAHRTARSATPAGIYYLVGSRKGAETEMVGWLHEGDVHEWSTRMAAYWADRSPQGGRQRPLLKGYLDPQALDQGHTPFFSEPPNSGDAPTGVFRRFPLLESEPSELEIDSKIRALGIDRKDRLAMAKLVKHYRLVVPGRACDPKRQDDCLSFEEMETRRQEFASGLSKIRNVDIMFLIDATDSMNKYFPKAAEAAVRFSQSLVGGGPDKPVIFVGAAIYGDYRGAIARFESVQFQVSSLPADMRDQENVSKLANRLATLQPYAPGRGIFEDEHEDALEAPYAALIRLAQQKSLWRDGTKIVIHIADHGNREKGRTNIETLGPTGSSKSAIREAIAVEDVAAALKSADIDYVPIPVAGRYYPSANNKFIEQAKRLLRNLGKTTIPVEPTYDEATGTETEATISERIYERIESAHKLVVYATGQVGAATGTAPTPLPALRQWEAQLSEEAIRRAFPDLKRQQAVFDRVQNVVRVYVRPLEQGQEMLSYWIALDEDSLSSLMSMFGTACITFGRRGSIKSLFDMIRQQAVAEIGDLGNASPGEVIRRQHYIPNFHLHPVLGRRESELHAILRDENNKEPEEWSKAFCRAEYLLTRVKVGKRVNADSMTFKDGVVRASGERPFNWQVTAGKGEGLSIYYVPIDYLP